MVYLRSRLFGAACVAISGRSVQRKKPAKIRLMNGDLPWKDCVRDPFSQREVPVRKQHPSTLWFGPVKRSAEMKRFWCRQWAWRTDNGMVWVARACCVALDRIDTTKLMSYWWEAKKLNGRESELKSTISSKMIQIWIVAYVCRNVKLLTSPLNEYSLQAPNDRVLVFRR